MSSCGWTTCIAPRFSSGACSAPSVTLIGWPGAQRALGRFGPCSWIRLAGAGLRAYHLDHEIIFSVGIAIQSGLCQSFLSLLTRRLSRRAALSTSRSRRNTPLTAGVACTRFSHARRDTGPLTATATASQPVPDSALRPHGYRDAQAPTSCATTSSKGIRAIASFPSAIPVACFHFSPFGASHASVLVAYPDRTAALPVSGSGTGAIATTWLINRFRGQGRQVVDSRCEFPEGIEVDHVVGKECRRSSSVTKVLLYNVLALLLTVKESTVESAVECVHISGRDPATVVRPGIVVIRCR